MSRQVSGKYEWYVRGLEFGILGQLAVWGEGGRELALGGLKQRALLAVLLLRRNELVPTARIVDELWGEQPPATAVKTVQVFVSQLRKALGEGVVETKPGGYLVRVAPGALDAERFEQALDEGRRLLAEADARRAGAVLRESLSLWRGPALADFQYEAFARNEIGRLEELRAVALELRLEAELAQGRHAEVVGELEALVRDQPLRERPLTLLMLALYRSGRQADALAAYQGARARLVEELGLDPSSALQQLEQAILRQDDGLDLPPAAPTRPVAEPTRSAPRPAEPAPEAQAENEARKVVTILFCDMVGYTKLAGSLDPEALRNRMSDFFEQAAVIIRRHGGTVEKFIGDEVMAVFGVPVVHEDDPLRAIRVAFELRDYVSGLDGELEVRIGVNTGEVVAGNPAAGYGFVSGVTVAHGKRIEEEAAPGEILIGRSTYMAVAHAVEATLLESGAARVESFDPDADALARRDDSLFVNRAAGLECLRFAYAQAVSGAGARLVTVVGEPGIGKSRLTRELVARLDPPGKVLVGRCPPYGEGITFWPLREVLHQAGREEIDLAGPPHEVFASVRRVLAELAAEQPLIVVVDDAHWAEPTFLDLVEHLASRLGDARVLLLCLARPQFAEQRPAWMQPPAESLVLEPLTGADSERLLESIGAPENMRGRIAEAAEGNPLFAEQLAAIAGDEGAVTMPSSIRGVLHERLDRLERDERSVLERAAIAGRSFSLSAVVALSPAEESEAVPQQVLSLVRKRFVRPDPLALDDGFRFQHALIREVAYDALPKSTRADLHERFAEWLDGVGGDLVELDEVSGYHLAQSYRYRTELGGNEATARAIGDRAAARLGAAGQRASGRGDARAAVGLFARAAELASDPFERARFALGHGAASREAGAFAVAEDVLARVRVDAAAAGWRALEAGADVELALLHSLVVPEAAGSRMREAGRRALAVFEELGDDRGTAFALVLLARERWIALRGAEMEELLTRALEPAERSGDLQLLTLVLINLARAAVFGPLPADEAELRCNALLERARAIGPMAAASISMPLGVVEASLGNAARARVLGEESEAVMEELALDLNVAGARQYAGLASLIAGDAERAETQLLAAVELLERLGERGVASTAAALRARALAELGRYDEAERVAEIALEWAGPEDVMSQAYARGALARAFAARGARDEARASAEQAVALSAGGDFLNQHADALLDLAAVLEPDAARQAAVQALAIYRAKGNLASAERATLLAG